MSERNGKMKRRGESSRPRVPFLGNYLIVTDTEKTECNYMTGLRDSIPKELQRSLVIKVCETKTAKLIDEAIKISGLNPQFTELWIMFDRDQVKEFDKIIEEASQAKINVGWSNPCIEIWFNAYLGTMPVCTDSVSCCKGLENTYLKKTSQKYKKANDHIYKSLCEHGNEKCAICLAKRKLKEHEDKGNNKPSEMCPATTVYKLVEEIKSKIKPNVE